MDNPLLFDQVKTLAERLAPEDRLRLVAYLCEQLSELAEGKVSEAEKERLKRRAEADALIAELDQVAALWPGECDAVADLREIRGEAP
jgi:hypothetical protein